MSEIDQDRIGSANPLGNEETEHGQLHIAEKANMSASDSSVATAVSTQVQLPTSRFSQVQEHTGTTEHLAARRPMPTLDAETPEMNRILATLRAEWTRLVTEFRWGGQSVEDIAASMIPLLNVGPVEQWKAVLIPFLYEIDRGGALIPAWLNVIEQGDTADLPKDVNPAETQIGRARRFAILMLGNYKMMGIAGLRKTSKLAKSTTNGNISSERGVAEILGDLAIDPNTSLYATQSLVKHATVPAIQALIRALKHAKGWAKVDITEACLELKQEQLYDLLIASGLDNASGLESYIATPIYRVVPLENYLSGEGKVSPRLLEQSALIFSRVLQDNTNPPPATAEGDAVPVIFERHLPTLAQALFRGARHYALWQNTVAIHHLSLVLSHYWQEDISGKNKRYPHY